VTHPTTAYNPQSDLDALAEFYGLELRLRESDLDEYYHDSFAWAVWGWNPTSETEDDADIIGAGESQSEAIESARKQLREWEENARAK
jgi:hypothetical protein